MRVYRLCRAEYSARVLSGEGGLATDGRWHRRGQRVVYTATSEALAVLELRVHLGRWMPRTPYRMHALDVPDTAITTEYTENLPAGWNAVPPGAASQDAGDRWLAAGAALALRVPSIHVRTEANVLVNPAHTEAQSVRVIDSWTLQFDPRLFAAAT